MRMSLFSKLEGQICLGCCVCGNKYIRLAPSLYIEYAEFAPSLELLVPENSGKT